MSILYAYDPLEQKHTKNGHPENSRRLESTRRLLGDQGVLDRMEPLPIRPIAPERLQRLHGEAYVERVKRLAEAGGGLIDPDTYVVEGSYAAALASAGAAVELTEAVMGGRLRRGLSLMRPPGHHALGPGGMGFCIFNNIAIAARAAREEFGAERVLIVDWDVHHGNGTEAMFYDDRTVAFFSTHQYPFYPGTGAIDDTGSGDGAGTTLNVPLSPGVGDAGYLRIFRDVLAPWARRFRPDIILVSAGFDAHWRDPLAGESLSVHGYGQIASEVVALADELCDGRVVMILEGGYDLDVLAWSVLASVRALEDPAQRVEDPFGPTRRAETAIDDVIAQVTELHGLGR